LRKEIKLLVFKSAFSFLKRLYVQRSLIWTLSVRALQARYAGTFAGMIWTVINPLVTILVYWFVFSVGFHVKPLGGVPFIVVFLCGFIPWTLFGETLMINANAITSNANLVKKTVFPTEILPVVNLVASFATHAVMILVLVGLLILNGIPLSFSTFQFLYYFAGLSLFSLGLSWIFSALNVFYKDVAPMIGVILNVWFWMTPITWMLDMLPLRWQFIIKLNPVYYLVEGYRSSFIYHSPHGHLAGIYFWTICSVTVVLGALIFKKLKPEFADVL